MHRLLTSAAALAITLSAGEALARDQIRIVGSSTVFPFSTAVAEQFGVKTGNKTPVVESTGTGGGMRLFCAGVGVQHPDMTNASRPITASEKKTCADNGVTSITEVKIGFDGIVLAQSKQGTSLNVTISELWLALAKEVPQGGKLVANPYRNWNEINASLPNVRIEVLGPPPTSGTRDAFVELVLAEGCKPFEEVKALEAKARTTACHTIREDGTWIDAGENDNLIVQKLIANPRAYGVFGFSFLEENTDKLSGSLVGGVEPTFDNIASGKYPVSRSIFFYVKNAHADVVPGIREFLAEFTSEAAFGPDGYLADRGLIPLPEADRKAVREHATGLTALAL